MSLPDDLRPEPLYAPQEPVFPRRVTGFFRNLKWGLMIFTLGIYYLTPWIRWERPPGLPDQAVLMDLADRRFFFFWIEIWPHEFYFIAGLLIMAGLGLFLFTSAAGRVWCGYACPQTVWTDLFVAVERWVEGDRNARLRLHKQKWDARKIRLRLFKWALWMLIAIATGGAWVFYFADAPTLLVNLVTGQASFVAYSTIAVLTFTTFLFGGFTREQMCIYMCPWPRIQAAMVDEDTITIGYRHWRGEPRGKHRKSAGADELGDCIDCSACANVCPMGIDIRDGQQLGCITCGLCIDACDDMMRKVGKPTRLIGYMALTDESREIEGQKPRPVWKHIVRPRTLVYTALWSAIGIALVVGLFIRSDIDLNVTPVRNPAFVLLADGSIRNTYDIRIRNKQPATKRFHVEIEIEIGDGVTYTVQGAPDAIVEVAPDETGVFRVFVTAAKDSAAARARLTEAHVWIHDTESRDRAHRDSAFNGAG